MSLPLQALEYLGELGEAGAAIDVVPVTIQLDSTAIASATYTGSEKLLTLNMRDGTILDYHEIPLATFTALVNSPSPGRFYNTNIRGAGFHGVLRV